AGDREVVGPVDEIFPSVGDAILGEIGHIDIGGGRPIGELRVPYMDAARADVPAPVPEPEGVEVHRIGTLAEGGRNQRYRLTCDKPTPIHKDDGTVANIGVVRGGESSRWIATS